MAASTRLGWQGESSNLRREGVAGYPEPLTSRDAGLLVWWRAQPQRDQPGHAIWERAASRCWAAWVQALPQPLAGCVTMGRSCSLLASLSPQETGLLALLGGIFIGACRVVILGCSMRVAP